MCEGENMYIYKQAKDVPETAKKTIAGGRLKGKTDINPMWRIKKLTELFGPCGVGWVTTDESYSTTILGNETVCIYELSLIFKHNGEWSKPIKGVGGSKLVAKEDGGLFVDDDAVKKAKTDALSVACKMLGIGASVYWEKDDSKYDNTPLTPPSSSSGKKQTDTNKNSKNTDKKSKYQQVATLIKTDLTGYWNIETVNQWIISTCGKDCRINDLPDDVFEKLILRLGGGNE